jgi:Tfp pilus assembly PilM family ATPase
MVSLPVRRRRTPIGLDIGAGGLRAVQLVESQGIYALGQGAVAEWSVDMDDDARTERLPDRIRRCLRQTAFSGRSAVTALQPPAVEFHPLELPPAVVAGDPANMVQVVRWEVGRLTHQASGDSETRHWALPPTRVPAPNVIGVAAPRGVIENRMAACAKAGLLCTSVDVNAAALVRLGCALHTWSGDELWAILDIGHRESRLVMCVGDVPVLVRRAGPGGDAWTERIAESLELSRQAAEVHKREHGIASTARGTRAAERAAPGGEVAGILLSALRSELKFLALEVKRSYEYALSCYPGRQVRDLVLVGGGATMRRLPEFMGGALGIPVRRATDFLKLPDCRLRFDPPGDAFSLEVFAPAVGLAMKR